jgi:hypothetical protein
VPEIKNRIKKKKVYKVNKVNNVLNVNKDIEVILEMNSDVIIHRLLNTEGDIEPFMLNEYNFINSENAYKKKKTKTRK